MQELLLKEDATVTICHSKTTGLPEIVSGADILVVAIGRPEFIKGDWIKPGAVVIDVGMNSVPGALNGGACAVSPACIAVGRGLMHASAAALCAVDATRKSGQRLVGDVEFAAAEDRVLAITPVPGGVGPMTVAMLMDNVVQSARRYADAGHGPWQLRVLPIVPVSPVPKYADGAVDACRPSSAGADARVAR